MLINVAQHEHHGQVLYRFDIMGLAFWAYMSEAASPPPSEVKIKLKHRDWEIEVSCVENKIREVIENVLTTIDNISNDQTESNIQINELKVEIESIKKTLNSWMKSLGRDIGSTDIQRKKVQKGGSTCRSLVEKLLLEGYF